MPSAAMNVPFRIKIVENDSDVERKNPLAFTCSHFWIAALCRCLLLPAASFLRFLQLSLPPSIIYELGT